MLCVLPVAAQHQGTPRPKVNQSLETQVERAVVQSSLKQHEQGCSCATKTDLTNEPLSLEELIEAEEELSSIRNQDIDATFEKYPYLLDPVYRRASEATKQTIRRPYLQKAWARKVGI